ncbi:hypothetical protein QTP86_012701 [Hemibagrus guttatus]|nr:hypothetical protein QTP86_012701 [Hemibagrus guttatus]
MIHQSRPPSSIALWSSFDADMPIVGAFGGAQGCQSGSPPPILSAVKEPCRAQFSEIEDAGQQSRYPKADTKVRSQRNGSQKTASLRSGYLLSTETHGRLAKAKSIGCLDKKLSIYKPSSGEDQAQKENQLKDGPPGGDTVSSGPLTGVRCL